MLDWYFPWHLLDWLLRLQLLVWLAAVGFSWWVFWQTVVRKRAWLRKDRRDRP